MDPMLSLFLKFFLVTLTFGALYVGQKYFKMKSGSIAEKVVEEVVQKETGVDVEDLENAAEAAENPTTTAPTSSSGGDNNSPSK